MSDSLVRHSNFVDQRLRKRLKMYGRRAVIWSKTCILFVVHQRHCLGRMLARPRTRFFSVDKCRQEYRNGCFAAIFGSVCRVLAEASNVNVDAGGNVDEPAINEILSIIKASADVTTGYIEEVFIVCNFDPAVPKESLNG